MILIPVTILGNVIVMAVIMLTPKLCKEPMYVLLTSLAFSDLLVGCLSMPIKAKIEWDYGEFHLPWVVCWIFQLGEIILAVASISHLVMISADRFLSLRYTYEYKLLMCRRIHFSVLLFVWTFSVVWSVLGIFQWNFRHDFSIRRNIQLNDCVIINRNYFTTTYILCFIIPVCLIVFIYASLHKKTRLNANAISLYDLNDSTVLKEKYHEKQQFKRLYCVMVVFSAYALCWMPCVVLTLIIYNDFNYETISKEEWFPALRFIFINFLPHLNSSMNPFLYTAFNKEFNCAIKKIFFKIIGNRIVGSYAYRRRNRFSMPADLRGILYSEDEDDGYELEVLNQHPDSPPRRRFTL